MGRSRLPDTEPSSVEDAGTELRGAALFKLIWDAVSDVVGTTAAAMILRRAAKRAMDRSPDLEEIEFIRTDVGYSYALPRALIGKLEQTPVALRDLVSELRPLLVAWGWKVVADRIEQIPELQARGIL
jgi:hypothetical protein